MHANEEAVDFSRLDDQQLFAERRRVRQQLERLPEHSVDRAELARLHAALTVEFERRARAAWIPASSSNLPTADDWLRKMRLAVDVLLAESGEISDGLEAELYALRDKLDVIALEQGR